MQNITYPKARRMVETTEYAEVIKEISQQPKYDAVMCETSTTTKPKVVAQLVNKMRALIQEIKIVIEAVIEKLSKDPELQQANSDRQSQTGKAQGPSLLW